jgi:5-methylcytosine-specific restriction protein B
MGVKTESELKDVFKNNIIPLLKEYFYNDLGKIRLVLGDAFVSKIETSPDFAVTDEYELLRDIYEVNPIDEQFDIVQALKGTIHEK